MYSVILMAAMTTPADAPSFGRLFNRGCWGCGGCAGSCVGYGCGCGGWNYAPAVRSACGGCTGCVGHVWAPRSFASCHGAGSCLGHRAYDVIAYGFAGCYGSCYGSHTNYFSYWQVPYHVSYGYGYPMGAGQMPPPKPVGEAGPMGDPKPKAPPMGPEPKPKAPGMGGIYRPTPGAVVVTLPADAKLTANGHLTRQTSAERRFATPPLEAGVNYTYEFTAEIIRDGKSIVDTITVEVAAGMESTVNFDRLIAATQNEPTRLASK